MTTDSFQAFERVDGPAPFLEFVRALIADRLASVAAESTSPSNPYGPAAGGWENTTIEAFLEAAVRWADSSGFIQTEGIEGANPWHAFANFLYCGKIYE